MSLRFEVDWTKDGDYSDVSENVTDLVRPNQGAVSFAYGRDQSTALAPTVSGNGSITLDNRDKRFSPRNTASSIYGFMKPARPVRAQRTIGANTYTLFVGHTDDNPINPDLSAKTVSLSLVDSLADFRGLNITTQLYSGVRTGQAIDLILDACGWSATLRDLDPGSTVIPWWWEDNTDALTALDKVLRSEGPPAMLTIGPDGSIVFKDRHHRLTDTASLTSQGTWRSTAGSIPTIHRDGFVYDEAWRNIINTGTVSVDVRKPAELQQVWTSDTPITLSSGEQKVITVSASDPFYDAVEPVEDTDFILVSGTVTAALTRTSGVSTGIILTAGGSSAVVTDLQLRAIPVPVTHTIQISASDTTSIADYGSRSFPSDLPWCNQYDAEAVLTTAVALRAQPLPIIELQFVIPDAVSADAVLARDLSDRVTIIEAETVTNSDFYIESSAHQLTGEHDHTVQFGVEAAPATISPMFRFDTAGQGFNDGKFGSGVDDPANMFRFDSTSGHRFNEGVFAS